MGPAGSAFSGLVARAATGERSWGSAAASSGGDGRRHTEAVPTPPLLADSSRPTSAHTSPAGSHAQRLLADSSRPTRLSASGGGPKTGDMQSGWPEPALLTPLDSALQKPAGAVQAGAANAHSLEAAEPGPKSFLVHGGVGTIQALERATVGATPDTSPMPQSRYCEVCCAPPAAVGSAGRPCGLPTERLPLRLRAARPAAGVQPPAGLRSEACSDRSPPREPWLLRLKLAKFAVAESAVAGLRGARLTAVVNDSRSKTAWLKSGPPGEQGDQHAVSSVVGRSASGEPFSIASSHKSSKALGEPNDLLQP